MFERVSHMRVKGTNVSGELALEGPLARGGRYDFNSASGSVTLALAPDESFRLEATISQGGDIISDFPQMRPTHNDAMGFTRRVTGVNGAGDATITFRGFSSTLRLRRR